MSVRKQTTKHKQDRNNKRQEATKKHKANKRTTLGTPVSQPNKKKRKTRQRTTLGTPRSSQQTNKVKNRFGFVQQAQCNKTKQQEKVNLKGPKLRKTPSPSYLLQNQVGGHFVLFLRQYYPSPFILDPSN